ncbi:hypothetical protein EON81_22725 [bacterium]|nr:MAG: hypothetical protein EON81_22725 [bacterium]
MERAASVTGYRPPTFRFVEGRELVYTNRGTFIGVIDLGHSLWTSLPPGNTEDGDFAFSGLNDANAWRLHPRVLPWTLAAPEERR